MPRSAALALLLLACNGKDATDKDGDGVPAGVDCDDDDAQVGVLTWYADGDGDGFGDPVSPTGGCEAPAGHSDNGSDCDDADPGVYPSAPERCDEVDQDCDGAIDESPSDAATWFEDADGDGVGLASSTTQACTLPEGYAEVDGDCDDREASVHPGAAPICGDGLDNDCDGLGDCGFALEGTIRAGEEHARITGTPLAPLTRAATLGGHDWDGDGHPDLVLGAPEASSNGVNTNGGVFLFTAPWSGEATTDDASHRLLGETSLSIQLGGALAAGDVTGDGAIELLAAASVEPGSYSRYFAGYVYIVSGGIDESLAPIGGRNVAELEGEESGDNFGAALVVGDFIGDETLDIVVSAPGHDASESVTNSGYIYLIEGPIPIYDDDIEDMRPLRVQSSDAFTELRMGEHLANAGDLDGDGQAELVVGVPEYSGSGRRGFVAALFDEVEQDGKLTALCGPVLHLSGDQDGLLGQTLAPLGDSNGDGYDDLLVAAPDHDVGSEAYAGRAWVISGARWSAAAGGTLIPEDVAEATLSGAGRGDTLGAAAEGLGDVTGDGLPDLLIGAPFAGERDYGQAMVFESPLRGSFEAVDALLTLDGISGLSGLGASLAVAGDLDSMGVTEIGAAWTSGDGGLLLLSPDAL